MFRPQPDSAVSVHVSLVGDDTPEAAAIAKEYAFPQDIQSADKPQSLLARAMLRRMLSDVTGTVKDDWSFGRGQNARPLAFHRSGPSPFAVSLSHSGRYVAAAIARTEAVGIDIEMRDACPDLDGVAALAFGPEERKRVETEGLPAFYRIWTLREAFAKATGLGLRQAADGLDRFAMPVPPDSFTRAAIPGDWFVCYREPLPALGCAVAVRLSGPAKLTPAWRWHTAASG